MYLCQFGGNPPTGSEAKSEKTDFYRFLKDGDL